MLELCNSTHSRLPYHRSYTSPRWTGEAYELASLQFLTFNEANAGFYVHNMFAQLKFMGTGSRRKCNLEFVLFLPSKRFCSLIHSEDIWLKICSYGKNFRDIFPFEIRWITWSFKRCCGNPKDLQYSNDFAILAFMSNEYSKSISIEFGTNEVISTPIGMNK